MQKLLALVLALLFNAQAGSIVGQLMMLNPSEPMIIGAEVRVFVPEGDEFKEVRKTTTNDDGSFLIEGLPEGRYVVTVSSNGSTVTDTCNLRDGEQCKLVFEF